MDESDYNFLTSNREVMIGYMYNKLYPLSKDTLSKFKDIYNKYSDYTNNISNREIIVLCYEKYIQCPNHNKKYE